MGRSVGVGVLAGGLAALVVAQLLSTAPARAEGLPVWVRIAAGVLVLLGVGAVVMPLWRARRGSPWTGSRVAFCLGAVLLAAWSVYATITDIRSGLPGPAIPLLAVGCVAVLVAAVLLCFEGRPEETPRATIDVHSRSDGSRTATLTTTDAVGPITDASRVTELIPAPGAVVLVVQNWDRASAQVVGLT